MNTIDDTLQQAGADLRNAVAAMPAPRSRHAPTRRRHGAAWALAAALVALLAIGVPILLIGGDPAPAPTGESPTPLPAADAGAFPRLSVDVAQLGSTYVLDTVIDEVTPSPGAASARHLAAYGPAGDGPLLPRLWIVTDPEGSDLFRGEAYREPGWESLAVATGDAFFKPGLLGDVVVWDAGNGAAVFAYSLGLDRAALVAAVDSLAGDGEAWAPQVLPNGFVSLYAGPERVATAARRVVRGWTSRDGGDATVVEVGLQLRAGGRQAFQRTLFAMLGLDLYLVEAVGAAEVRGHPAVRVDYDGGTAYLWMETPEVYADLHVSGLADPDDAVAALVEVDEATWAATLPDGDPTAAPPDTMATNTTILDDPQALLDDIERDLPLPPGGSLAGVRARIAELTTVDDVVVAATIAAACQWGEVWLQADIATDPGVQLVAERALLEIAALSNHYTPVQTDVWALAGAAADGQGDAARVAAITAAICP